MHTMMKALLGASLAALSTVSSAQATLPEAQDKSPVAAENRDLIDLNSSLFHSMIVQADPTPTSLWKTFV